MISPKEDGDAIVIEEKNLKELDGEVSGNVCINALKRGIKVMASKVLIKNNIITRTIEGAYSGISVYGNDCILFNNYIKADNGVYAPGVEIKGTRNIINKNKIENRVFSDLYNGDGIEIWSLKDEKVSVKITNNEIINFRYSVRVRTITEEIEIINNKFLNYLFDDVYFDKIFLRNTVYKDNYKIKFNK